MCALRNHYGLGIILKHITQRLFGNSCLVRKLCYNWFNGLWLRSINGFRLGSVYRFWCNNRFGLWDINGLNNRCWLWDYHRLGLGCYYWSWLGLRDWLGCRSWFLDGLERTQDRLQIRICSRPWCFNHRLSNRLRSNYWLWFGNNHRLGLRYYYRLGLRNWLGLRGNYWLRSHNWLGLWSNHRLGFYNGLGFNLGFFGRRSNIRLDNPFRNIFIGDIFQNFWFFLRANCCLRTNSHTKLQFLLKFIIDIVVELIIK